MAEEVEKGEIIIFKAIEGPEIEVQIDGGTVWLSQTQMAGLFQKDFRTISFHINQIY
jgi:hypothetical protein